MTKIATKSIYTNIYCYNDLNSYQKFLVSKYNFWGTDLTIGKNLFYKIYLIW